MEKNKKYYIEVSKNEYVLFRLRKSFLITVQEYEALRADSDLLGALQTVGVNNWQGYKVAQNMIQN